MTIAEQLKEEGEKEGIKKGIQEGMQKGIQQGVEKGVKETEERFILNMLEENIDPDTIMRISNISPEQLAGIRKRPNT